MTIFIEDMYQDLVTPGGDITLLGVEKILETLRGPDAPQNPVVTLDYDTTHLRDRIVIESQISYQDLNVLMWRTVEAARKAREASASPSIHVGKTIMDRLKFKAGRAQASFYGSHNGTLYGFPLFLDETLGTNVAEVRTTARFMQ